jgi:hypothetical protein
LDYFPFLEPQIQLFKESGEERFAEDGESLFGTYFLELADFGFDERLNINTLKK